MPLLRDTPDGQDGNDRLDFARFVVAMAATVFPTKHAPATPLTIGLHGRWGSGKSTVLELLHRKLDGSLAGVSSAAAPGTNPRYRTIRFEPWAFQHEKHLLIPLLLALQPKLDTTSTVTREILKLGRVSLRYFLNKHFEGEEIAKAGEQEEAEAASAGAPEPQLSDIVRFKQAVSEVVGKIRGDDILVVLIDDLDRCHPPERIVELLEQIKVFLDLEGCIFVVACDQRVVSAAIEAKFPGEGTAYLEKFIQLPFFLPEPFAESLADLLMRGVTDLPGREDEWSSYWARIAPVLGGNPRRMKRLYNQCLVCRQTIVASGTAHAFDDFLLVKWLLLREMIPGVAQDPGIVLLLEQTLDQHPQTDRWFCREHNIPPQLAIFLEADRGRRFGNFTNLGVYARLSSRENVFTRERAERMTRAQEPYPPEISDARLRWAYLPAADFSGRKLERIDFRDADLGGANFDQAQFVSGDVEGARLDRNVRLNGAIGLDSLKDSKEKLFLLQLHAEQNVNKI